MDRFIQRSRPNEDQADQPASAQLHSEPPRKRARLVEVKDSDEEDGDSTPALLDGDEDDISVSKARTADENPPDSDDEEEPSRPGHETAFENSLPAVPTDKEAIEEYEAMRASQALQDDAETASARIDNRQWVRGKSSIYVDAFNLALDTVLEDESHLFDAREKCVFEQWRALSYEAQYL
jgi:Fanconi-associated nuclease 1